MTDPETYRQKLLECDPLREPTLRSAIEALRLPAGSQGVQHLPAGPAQACRTDR